MARGGYQRQVNFPVAYGVVVGAEGHRQSVTVSNPSANQVVISFGQALTGSGQGISIPSLGLPVTITREMIGALIDTDIYGVASAAGTLVTFLIGYD